MRVFIIDDEPLFRRGVKTVLAEVGMTVIGEAGTAREAFELLDRCRPEVVVMDIVLPGMDGIAATREVRRRAPDAKILVMSGRRSGREVVESFKAGATGYAVKTDSPEALIEAIRCVAQGEQYVASSLGAEVRDSLLRKESLTDVLGVLSSREREVFMLLVTGLPNQRIARELCVSMKTLGTHRHHIYEKLGCHSMADLMRFAALNGLLRGAPGDVGSPGHSEIAPDEQSSSSN